MKKLLIISFFLSSFIFSQVSRENSTNIVEKDGLLYRLDMYLEFGVDKGPYSGKVFTVVPKSNGKGNYVTEEYFVLDGKKHGSNKIWNDWGIVLESNYKFGKLDGLTTVYYQNGQIQDIGFFKNGVRDGPWIEYESNGKIKSRKYYKNGKRKKSPKK